MFLVMLKLFCIFAVCYGRQPHKHKEEVIDTSISANGSPQQAYTVLLSLTNFNTVFCSGTLLNEYWVLTIATCLKRGKLTDITVHKETKLPNGTITYTGKRFARIERAFIHQEFGVPLSTYNDLAILRLDRAIEIYENQTRIVLPTKVEDVEMKFRNQPLHMTRYCSIHNSIEYKDAFPQDRAMCNYPYNKASFNKIFCALFQEERKTKFKDASDKGGPVVDRNHTLYGLVPYALLCRRMADRYCFCGFTKIDMFVDFINDTINNYENGIAGIYAAPVPPLLFIFTFIHSAT